jgi:hypothetical protein
MDNELITLLFGTLGDTFDIGHTNFALNCRAVLNIVKILVGQEKYPILTKTKLVFLLHLATK